MASNLTDQCDNQTNIFAEPLTELWKKLFGTVTYMLTSFCGLVMLVFVGYERQGLASNYRTALNQLNSWILLFVS